jgi:hypothetical protein
MFTGAGRTASHSLALLQSAAAANRGRRKTVSEVYSEQVNIGPAAELPSHSDPDCYEI